MSSAREKTAFLFLLITLAIIPLCVASFSLARPSTQQNSTIGALQLRSISIDLTGSSQKGVTLDFNAVFYNPNGFRAMLDGVNYSVYANGHFVGSGGTAHEYDFAPRSTLTLAFPVSIGWKSAFQTLGIYAASLGGITWEVNGTANIEVGGLPLSISFELSTA